jgi:hypothetical protein
MRDTTRMVGGTRDYQYRTDGAVPAGYLSFPDDVCRPGRPVPVSAAAALCDIGVPVSLKLARQIGVVRGRAPAALSMADVLEVNDASAMIQAEGRRKAADSIRRHYERIRRSA